MNLGLLLLLLLATPLTELYVMIKLGGVIGAGWTVGLVVATAALGLILVRVQGFGVLGRIRQDLASGAVPALPLIEGACLFLAGGCLLFPGFLTDLLGFILLVPPLRRRLVRFFARHFLVMRPVPGAPASHEGSRLLDGESRRVDRNDH